MSDLAAAIGALVTANRIVANENVCDSYGHVSIRHPDNPNRYLLAYSRSPSLVVAEDIVTFELDGTPVDLGDRTPYSERAIHGARRAIAAMLPGRKAIRGDTAADQPYQRGGHGRDGC